VAERDARALDRPAAGPTRSAIAKRRAPIASKKESGLCCPIWYNDFVIPSRRVKATAAIGLGIAALAGCTSGTGAKGAGAAGSDAAPGPSGADSGSNAKGSANGGADAGTPIDATSSNDDVGVPAMLDAGAADATVDAGVAQPADAARSSKVLIYAVTSPGSYRHASIPAAAAALARAAQAAGLTTEIVGASDATNVVDPTKFTAEALAQDGAVILLANDGEPFGYPATQEIQNLSDYVHNGGALVATECATDCYGGAYSAPIYNHPLSLPYHMLLGATFTGHTNFAPAKCTTIGATPSVAQLAPAFNVTDEIYGFKDFAMDNQVVVTCVSSTLPNTVRPISWFREIGAGRYFYTALGHPDTSWTMPMDANQPSSRLVEDHIIHGLLWAMRR
jgi:type 1 glutamine amidotransferase